MIPTCNARFQRNANSRGYFGQGGYANKWRGPSHFAVRIPDNLDPAQVPPFLCDGLAVFSPLMQYGAGRTAKEVGIVGIGGLDHFAVLFASAMGADVTVISSSHSEKEDAVSMGAKTMIIIGNDPSAAIKDHIRSLDLILCTPSMSSTQSAIF